MHLHLTCFCSTKCIHFIFISRMSCMILAFSSKKIQTNKMTKKRTKSKCWLTVFEIKRHRHSCDLIFIILENFSFWEKSELSRIGFIWINLSIENPSNISHPWKFIFENLYSFFLFFLATRSRRKTAIDTSKPYTSAMRGTGHEPQANLGANQKFSPNRLKTQKGGLSKN